MTDRSTSSLPAPARRGPPALLWILLVPIALVLIAWATLALMFPPPRVRAIVQSQVAGVLDREVRYQDARVSLWPPIRLTVIEPAVAEPGGFERGTALRARSIHLDLNLLALLAQRLVVRRLVLDQPQLHLVLRADGTTNFDQLTKAGAPASSAPTRPLDLAVQELAIDGGRVLVDDLGASRRVAFGVRTRVALSAEAGGARIATTGTTVLSDLAFGPLTAARVSDLNTSFSKLEWTLRHQGKYDARQNRLALESLSLSFGSTAIALSGLVDQPGPNALLNLKAHGHGVDLAQIMGFLAAADAPAVNGIQAAGTLDFDLGVNGRLAQHALPSVTGTVTVANASFRYPGAPASVEQLNFGARLAADSLGIADLRATVKSQGLAQPVRAQLALTHFADPQVSFALQGDLDLAAVGPLVAPKDVHLGGRVAVDVRGRGRSKDPTNLALEGRAQLNGVSVEGAGLPKRVEAVNGAIAFSNTRAEVKALSARAGKSSFTLDATLTRPLALMAKPHSTPPSQVDFTLTSPYLDLAELLPVTPGGPLAPNASGGGRLRIDHLKNQKLDVTHVDARVTLEPGVVVVPAFAMNGYDGRVTGHARFDLNDATRPVFAVNAKVDSVEADAILSAWTPLKGLLRGKLSTAIDLSGAGQTPELLARTLTAEGLAGFVNGTLGPTPALEAIAREIGIPSARVTKVQELRLPFTVQRGRVVSDGATLRTSLGAWKFTGSAGFDGSLDYALSGTLPKDKLSGLDLKSALAIGGLTDHNGDVLLDLKLGGTATAPRVSLDTRAMQARVEGKLSESLTEQTAKVQDQLKKSLLDPLKAGGDSTHAPDYSKNAQALIDSLKHKRGADILKGFFGSSRKDSTP